QQRVAGVDHDLAYRGLQSGAIDATDLYSTDAEIRFYQLRVLEDDLHVFPEYRAVLLYRAKLKDRAPEVLRALSRLEGAISESKMTAMNARVKLERIPEARVAAEFLRDKFGIEAEVREETLASQLLRHLKEHLFLVSLSLLAAIAVS